MVALIRRLRREGFTLRQIVRMTGCSNTTVQRYWEFRSEDKNEEKTKKKSLQNVALLGDTATKQDATSAREGHLNDESASESRATTAPRTSGDAANARGGRKPETRGAGSGA